MLAATARHVAFVRMTIAHLGGPGDLPPNGDDPFTNCSICRKCIAACHYCV